MTDCFRGSVSESINAETLPFKSADDLTATRPTEGRALTGRARENGKRESGTARGSALSVVSWQIDEHIQGQRRGEG